jgi:hypothetical protein
MPNRTIEEDTIWFPCEDKTDEALKNIIRLCNCFEDFEFKFGLEFSCGEGHFIADLMRNDALASKYEELDGMVSFTDLPRYRKNKELLKPNKAYTFKIVEVTKNDRRERIEYYLNSKLTHKEDTNY